MQQYTVASININTHLHFNVNWHQTLKLYSEKHQMVYIIDENVARFHPEVVTKSEQHLIVPSGERAKSWTMTMQMIEQLLNWNLSRSAILVGIGGGVVSDLVGFVASIYKRGISCIFIPTTILAMVDAAIGGKNGINVGDYKNMVGTITQPIAIIYDYTFLSTLPHEHWANGFAEVIKHAIIQDEVMFNFLKQHNLSYFQKNLEDLSRLIQENVQIKTAIVSRDATEQGDRKILNFGHTLAHAIEKKYDLLHGYAVSIGMVYAAQLSEQFVASALVESIVAILQDYELPTALNYDKNAAIRMIFADKKADADTVDFVLLHKIGDAYLRKILISNL